MSRTRPEQSKAKLRDAELAEAERLLMEAHQQLAAMKAEIDRSNRLLEQQAAGRLRRPKPDPRRAEFDGFAAASALGLPSADQVLDGS